jgi:CheY-like chemotaxis protein
MRSLLVERLSRDGYHVTGCENGLQLLDRLSLYLFPEEKKGETFDLVITDNRMPGLLGLEVLEGLRPNRQIPPLILITAFGDAETHREARKAGVVAVFNKPFDIEGLSRIVRETLHAKETV